MSYAYDAKDLSRADISNLSDADLIELIKRTYAPEQSFRLAKEWKVRKYPNS